VSIDQTGTPPPAPEPSAPALTVPLNADGSIGTLPDPLQKLIDSRIREATARAKAKAAPDPVETERLKTLESELESYRLKDAEAGKRYEEAIAIREAREAAERDRLQAEIDRRTARLKRAVQAEIQAAALRAGARDESLDELVALLAPKVDLNDDLDPVVDGADSIDALVVGYLDTKPHHRRGAGGQSMSTIGGVASRTGTAGAGPMDAVQAVLDRIKQRGRPTGQDLKDLAAARAGGRA
jgi:hypothetical protein